VDSFTHSDDTPSIRRSNQRPKNHDQAISHHNKLITKLNTLQSRAISHPIHRLPLELLEHIFHLLLELGDKAFPLNLTQVCSQWKSLVLSVRNRRLWSRVWIDPADPDWLGLLHIHLFLSRDEGLNICIEHMTQSIADELARHHRRIRSLAGSVISQVLEANASEPDTVQVFITNPTGRKPFPIPLSSSVKALPVGYLGEGSLHRLQSLPQLQELQVRTKTLQLHKFGSPLQLPALQRLVLFAHENPLEVLKIFSPSRLLVLQLRLPRPLSPTANHELEVFIIQHMPNLRWVALAVVDYIDSEFVQPVEESITQSLAAKQSESLRRIDLEIVSLSETSVPPFGRLIESAPHLDECHLKTPMQSWPCFSHHIRELELEFRFSRLTILHLMNVEPFKLVHLEVFKLTFSAPEQSQLLTLFQAPSLLSLEVSEIGSDEQDYSTAANVVLAFLSTSQGIRYMKLGFPVNGMNLSLPELQNLEVTNTNHIFVLPSFNVPKLQRFFLEIGHRCGEDESITEDPICMPSPPPSFEAVGGPNAPDMVITRPTVDMGNEAQMGNILEEDENGEEMSRFKATDLHEAPSDPVVTSAPTFPASTFKNLTALEFKVSRVSGLYPPVLPYFPDMLIALPALERVTLPAVTFKVTPYIDQLVNRISKIPTLCPHLQEIRTCDYPNEWSNLLKLLRDRKRASLLSDPTLRPIHALHFPITPHGSIVEQLQDAMLGKVSIKSFPVLFPRPSLIDSTFVRLESSRGEDTTVDSNEETRSQVQYGNERTAATGVQAQEENATRSGNEENKSEEESGCGENEDEALSCFNCHKAGLGAGCHRAFWKQDVLSRIDLRSGDVLCPRWDPEDFGESRFEAICLP